MAEKAITTTDINKAIKRQGEKSKMIKIGGLSGQDSVAVGIDRELELLVIGDAGDFFCALNDKAVITLEGNAGNYMGDNMSGGGVIIKGNAGNGVGAYMKGGIAVIKGNAGDAVAAGNRFGTVIIAGDAGNDAGLMQSGGNVIICGSVKKRLGHLMTGGGIFLGGKAESIGDDLKVLRITDEERKRLKIYFEHYGIDSEAENFTKIVTKDERRFETATPNTGKLRKDDGLSSVSMPSAVLYSPVPMDFDLEFGADATEVTIGNDRIAVSLTSSLPLMIDLPLNGLIHSSIKGEISRLSREENIPYIHGSGTFGKLEEAELERGAKALVCWSPGREGISHGTLRNSSGIVVDICSGLFSPHGAGYFVEYDERMMEGLGLEQREYGPTPQRHLDMNSIKDLKNHISMLKEFSDHSLPVIVRMEAGRVYQDLKLAIRAGADSVVINTYPHLFGRKEGAVDDGYPFLGIFPIIRRIKKEVATDRNVLIGLEMDMTTGMDLVKTLALGADYIVLSTQSAIGCGKCSDCVSDRICRSISPILPGTETSPEGTGDIIGRLQRRIDALRVETHKVLVSLSLATINGLSHDLLYAKDYSTASITGLKLAGYNRKLPMWLH